MGFKIEFIVFFCLKWDDMLMLDISSKFAIYSGQSHLTTSRSHYTDASVHLGTFKCIFEMDIHLVIKFRIMEECAIGKCVICKCVYIDYFQGGNSQKIPAIFNHPWIKYIRNVKCSIWKLFQNVKIFKCFHFCCV